MKPKEIILLGACALMIIGSGVFMYFTFFGGKAASNQNQTASSTAQPQVSGKIDEDLLRSINQRKSYGQTDLENIGRTDPFGQLN